MPDAEKAVSMPFGRFFGRRTGEREFGGFTLGRFVPSVGKRDVRRHRHDEAHFVFVLRGEYETTARRRLGPSSATLIYSPPGTEHSDGFVDHDVSRTAFAALSVSPAALAGVESVALLPEQEVCLDPAATPLVRRLLDELERRDDLSESIAEALSIELLQRTGVDRDVKIAGAPGWLRRARELLRDSSLEAGPRSIHEIAGVLGVHPVQLARRFRQHFGETPGEYLRRCRLERARQLLLRTRASVAEIAITVGFCDQSHFANAFRRAVGVSPGSFRRS